MKRVPRSEQTREALRTLFEHGSTGEDPKTELVRLAIRQIVEEVLEAEVRDRLGRGHYERGADGAGYRNGYREGHLDTSEGEVRFAVPQVRDVPGGFRSEVRERVSGRTEGLEQLAVEMYARGLSTRDIEAVFRDEDGQSLLSRSAVSEVTEVLWKEYEDFATRDLGDLDPLYLFVDGIAERLRPGSKREAVLAAWAILATGRKVLVHLAPGTKESTECCKDFFQDLRRRGLRDPALVVTDGAPGLIRAVDECFPSSLRQRCLAHRMRNLRAKVPETDWADVREAAKAAYQAPSPAMARALRDDLETRFEKVHPTAVRCFLDDFEACIAHLRCPPAHRRVIRTTNLLERLFGEERRRLNAAKTMFGERAVLKLMYASLLRASETWRGLTVTELERRQLDVLRQQLAEEHTAEHAPAVTTTEKPRSRPSRVSSKDRT